MKKQNPIAQELRTPKYRKRVVKDKTIYDRKRDEEDDDKRRFEDHLCEVAAVEKLNKIK